jgi:hypothetical protein
MTSLSIIPTNQNTVEWGKLKSHWMTLLSATQKTYIGQGVALVNLKTKKHIGERETLAIGTWTYLELAIPNTLGIGLPSSQTTKLAGHELEYLDEATTDIPTEALEELAKQWAIAGYTYKVMSSGGRGKHEFGLMLALTIALAELSGGYVHVIETNPFTENEGLYHPDQFRNFHPKY